MALPIPPSGRAVGQLIAAINDGPDEDSEPQIIPARGEASFTATVSHVPVPGAEPNPYTLIPRPRTGVFDENGYLCTPRTNLAGEILLDEQGHPLIEAQGVKLTASEIDGTSVENWTWSVSLRLTGENGKWLQTLPAFSLPVPAGGEVDITKYMGVPATVPIGTAQAFLLVDQAEQHARAAVEASSPEVLAGYVTTEGNPVRTALQEQIISETAGAFAPVTEDVELDIWPAFNPTGATPESWEATTYAPWIEGIDRKLGGSAAKATVGTASDGKPIYAYTAGRSTAPHVLVVGGTHGHEMGAQFAAMRFFTEFAANPHPLMVSLRAKAKITWIPTLSASAYRQTRQNSNGVDVNRNWPWNWAYGASSEKGAAPLDQPEAQAIKNILDAQNIALLVDCHDNGPTSPEMSFSATSIAVHAHREIFSTAAARWNATNPDAPAAASFTGDEDIAATLRNWGGKYLRWDKGRVNAASLLLEGKAGMAGSNSNQINRTGARWYASFIYKAITTWLEHGQTDAPYVAHKYWAVQEIARSGTAIPRLSKDVSIQQEGRLVDTTTYTAVPFNYSSSGNDTNYIGFPIRHPGRYLVEWSVNVELVSDAPTRVDGRIAVGPMPLDGSNLTSLATPSSGYVELRTKGDFGTVRGQFMLSAATVPDDTFQMAQLFLRVSKADGRVITRDSCGAILTVTPMPNFAPARQPVVKRPQEALPY